MEGATAMNPKHPCCTTSGEVVALSAATGEIAWRHRVVGDEARQVGVNAAGTPVFAPSGAPVWSSPTIDPARGRLYVGTGENFTRPATTTSDSVLALDLASGAFAWAHQGTADDAWNLACVSPHRENCPLPLGPDVDFGMAPIPVTREDGVTVLVAGQKSGDVWALDPQREGAVLWKTKVGKGGTFGGIHWGMASDARRVYVPISDSPAGMQGIEPDFPPAPGLHALDLADGRIVWSAAARAEACAGRERCVPGNSAAPTVAGDVVFAGSLDGHMRAYSTRDGAVLWDFDTVRDFATVNGVPARGGALDGPGPVVANGMLFVTSGYGLFGQMPGNVLLAFRLEHD
jgi:polyvinyl alcohol dehydrogenase (cytochrome)